MEEVSDLVELGAQRAQSSVTEFYRLCDQTNDMTLVADLLGERMANVEARLRGELTWADAGVPGQGLVPLRDITNEQGVGPGPMVVLGEGSENVPPPYAL